LRPSPKALLDGRGVGDRHLRVGHHERHLEGRLEIRLVESGKGPPRVDRLELRVCIRLSRLAGEVEPDDLPIEGGVPLQMDRRLPRCGRLG
jgi:hypothetical protein